MVRRYSTRVDGFRSKFEQTLAGQLEAARVDFTYESARVHYTDTKPHYYKPDFTLPSGVHIEGKGEFTSADRTKHLLIRQQHPDVDIRFVFESSKRKLSKTSTTTYADWCERHRFLYADKIIPKDWLK